MEYVQKYYAVKHGPENGIYDNWAEWNKQVCGYSGAFYKVFESLEEAEAYYNLKDTEQSTGFKTEEELMSTIGDKEVIAYVDGSNLGDGSKFSWGVVLFSKDTGKQTISGSSDDERFIQYRNIAGELFASVEATKFALANEMDLITIYHDYSGIRHWALGEWKTNNPLSVNYMKFFEKATELIEVRFVKVAGHTGDTFNEEADVLAKNELGIEVKK